MDEKEDITSSPAHLHESAPGAPEDFWRAEDGDIEPGGTIRFNYYTRQVAWDRFWDQM